MRRVMIYKILFKKNQFNWHTLEDSRDIQFFLYYEKAVNKHLAIISEFRKVSTATMACWCVCSTFS